MVLFQAFKKSEFFVDFPEKPKKKLLVDKSAKSLLTLKFHFKYNES